MAFEESGFGDNKFNTVPNNVIEGEIIEESPFPSEKVETKTVETVPENNMENKDEFPMGYPMRETLKMLGVKPEKSEVKTEGGDYPMDYPMRDTLKSMGIKYEGGIDNTNSEKLEEGLLSKAGEKIEQLKEKTTGVWNRAWGKLSKFGSKAKEVGMSAINIIDNIDFGVENNTIYVKVNVKEKYEGVINSGIEKINTIKQTAENAREIFKTALEMARNKKDEKLSKVEEDDTMKEYLKTKKLYNDTRDKLIELKKKMNPETITQEKMAA